LIRRIAMLLGRTSSTASWAESPTSMRMKCVGKAPDFLGDLSDGRMGIENTAEGVLSNFGTATVTRHRREGKNDPTFGTTTKNYPDKKCLCKNVVPGAIARKRPVYDEETELILTQRRTPPLRDPIAGQKSGTVQRK